MKILITQIGSMGDCLLTTTIARQIKEIDYPGCHLTWLVGDKFKNVLAGNPHVDEISEIPVAYTGDSIIKERNRIDDHIRGTGGGFDKVFVFDLNGRNKQSRHYYGTYRSTYFRIYHELYGHRVVVSPEPVINLNNNEVARVNHFVNEHRLAEGDCYPVLIECDPRSCQSSMNIETALYVAEYLVRKHSYVKCLLSRKDPVSAPHERIIDASGLTYRENAELLNHCRLLIGANSGITWLNASTWSRKIPAIQYVAGDWEHGYISSSVEMDYRNVGMSTESLIELSGVDRKVLCKCADYTVRNSIAEAKKIYRERDVDLVEYFSSYYSIKKYGHNIFVDSVSTSRKCTRKTKIFFLGIPILTTKKYKT